MKIQGIKSLSCDSKKSSKIIGHRGARGEVLENTHLGFEYAQNLIQDGISGIEFDIQRTADDKLVVFHDDTVGRLFGQQGRLEQLPSPFFVDNTLLNNTRLNNACLNKTLLLQDMPSLLANYHHIELEIKTHKRTNHQKLIDCLAIVLAEFPSGLAISLTSFDVTILEKLQYHAYLSQFPRGLLIEQIIEPESKLIPLSKQQIYQLINTALRLQCSQVGIMASLISAELIQSCHRYGLSVTAWTVNDMTQAQWLFDNGVDWVITDYPKVFLTSGLF